MKKRYISIFIILFVFSIYLKLEKQSECKIIKIINPTQVFVDLNKDLIFDEKSPITIENVYYITKEKQENEDKIFNVLTKKERNFLHQQAIQTSKDLLKNKFVKIKNNEIYINNKKYKDLLLNSDFFYENNKESKQKIINNIKKYNIDEYVILNTKSRRYHTLSCDEIWNIKNSRIIKKDNLQNDTIPCQKCKEITETKEEKPLNVQPLKYSFEKENIKIIYTDLNEIFKPSKKCSNLACKTLKQEIDNAKESIDFAIYGISNQPEIITALVNAQNRGVKIRWVCDFDKKDKHYYKDTNKLKKLIQTYNTDEKYDKENKPAIMHNKFFIFDNKKVFTGSSNITSTDLSGFNENVSLIVSSKEIANIYTQEFEQLYNGHFHLNKMKIEKRTIYINETTKITPVFSPKNKVITEEIIPLIRKAQTYIFIPVFFITKKELLNELIYAQNKGVDVKVIIDATSANTQYSIHKELRNNGIRVKVENFAGKLHSKAIIIDDKYTLIGSLNFTNNGEKRNDENALIIEDKEIAQYMKNVFLNLWNKIPNRYEQRDAVAESRESIGSCSDGIDNDFDDKIDNKDSGCYLK